LAQDPDAVAQRARKLGRAFAAITALTYALIVLGALVRAHGAGLACPDWPLCFGELVPRFDVRVAFEWGHRVAAGSISLLFVAASVVTLRDPDLGPAVRRTIFVSAALLGVQILLGALTVWHLLASWTVTSHLLTGNAFALGLAFTTRSLLRIAAPPPPRPPIAAPVRGLVTATTVVLAAQMVLGGLVASSYAGLACTEWPTCNEGVWFPGFQGALGIQLSHRLGAYTLVLCLAGCAWLGRGQAGISRLLLLAFGLVLAQVGVGVLNVLLRLPVEITGLHSALAAGLVLCVALALAECWRPGKRPART
jgi:cytochrome c oxidase assembly protein subunit 15